MSLMKILIIGSEFAQNAHTGFYTHQALHAVYYELDIHYEHMAINTFRKLRINTFLKELNYPAFQ